jgi:hypothetical protein
MIEITATAVHSAAQTKRGFHFNNMVVEAASKKSYLRLYALRLGATDSKDFRHSHQVSHRSRAHFLHKVPAVYLHRNLGEADLGRNLLVQEATSDQS